MALPIVITLVYAIFPTEGAGPQPLTSISIYAWTDAGVVFDAFMTLIGGFLLTNCVVCFADRCWFEAVYGGLSGASALLVVAFPTGVEGARAAIFCPGMTPCGHTGLHAAAAGAFILTMIGYALYFFVREPRLRYWQAVAKFPVKRFYIAMGSVIIVMLLWMALVALPFLNNLLPTGVAGFLPDSVFWPEAFAVLAFGAAWMVKGYVMRETRHRAMHSIKSLIACLGSTNRG
ncbi:MAG: hypothetical protein AAGE13_06990 [Pseudomonadota bacterium]